MEFTDILRPYERLVEITILGERREVPENNSLLRCFQFLSPETVSYADLCWNGSCMDCQVWIKNGDKEKSVLACRTDVQEGMEIVRMPATIELG
ncbi:MAG TPA: 2Fe-2S iron-sulfur cluster-binding protein [Pyrinomonadaceae bacterium]|jgi:succinate dehydrogenase/fumarate reductase-like Fe-S protein